MLVYNGPCYIQYVQRWHCNLRLESVNSETKVSSVHRSYVRKISEKYHPVYSE